MDHESLKGRIDYLSMRPGQEGRWRGSEDFLITKHRDGRRTLRATCIIDENEPRVLRDCVTNLAPDWSPTGGFVQISVDGEHAGSAWYDIEGRRASVEGHNRVDGRLSRTLDLDESPGFFGSHALQADGFMTHCYDLNQGPGRQVVPLYLACSAHHRGADGPTLVVQRDISLTLLGQETLTVKAGTFEALHFRVGAEADDDYMGTERHPHYHVWDTADGEHVYLKGHITGYFQSVYELVEFKRGPGWI
ncbi:MAG: hypothetical protein ABW169_01140 [Sphingobium sp.]